MADVFKTVLDISLAASALALIAMAARLVIGRRPNAALPLLSALVILRLAIPVTIPSPLSVMNLFADIGAEQPAAADTGDVNETPEIEFTPPAREIVPEIAGNIAAQDSIRPGTDNGTYISDSHTAAEPEADPLTPIDIAAMIWIAGMAAMAACVAAGNIRFTLMMRKNRMYDLPGFGGLLELCKAELNFRRRIEAVQLSGINTAAVYGIFRAKLLISPFFGSLSDEEKKHVLLHELSHIKRRDILVCLIIASLNVVYWFNPVIWAALALARRDMEVMCDMAVLRHTQNKRSYASTLFSVASASNTSKSKLVSALFMGPQSALRFGMLISTDSIKRRMKMITRYKRSRLFTAVSIILVFAIAITGCTGAMNTPKETGSAFTPPEIDGQELIASYSLDFSSIADDEARVANIKKAAQMLDGTVFMGKSIMLSKVEDYKRLIDIPNVFSPITEEAGWHNAAWTGWGSIEECIHKNDETSGYFAASPEAAEPRMQAGGGLEIAAMAYYNAASLAGLYCFKPVSGLDPRGFKNPANDNVNSGGVEVMNNRYESDLILRMRVNDNRVIAAFYTPPETVMKFSIPKIEGKELIAFYSLDFSSIASDEARAANIKKTADMLDGTVLPYFKGTSKGICIPRDLEPITEEAGWQNAAGIRWASVDLYIRENATSGYFTPGQGPPAETKQVGGGAEIAAMALYKAAKRAGLILSGAYHIGSWFNEIYGDIELVENTKYQSGVILKMWVEENCVIAAFYAP